MFSEEKLLQTRQKKQQQQSISIKSFYSNTFSGFKYKKLHLSKFPIKMFIKRVTRAGKTYAY